MTTNILFVCHGNICRSPLAHSIMQHLVDDAGCADEFVIDSAATTTEELGNPIYPFSRDKLKENNIPIVEHYARKISRAEANDWDYIVCMDEENIRHLRGIIGKDGMQRVWKMMDFVTKEGARGSGRDVADPWYSRDFDKAYDDIYAGCEALLRRLV